MAYPYPLRIEGLLVEEEVTYGTDPTPVASTEGIRGVGRIWSAMTPEWAFPNKREDVVSNSLIGVAPGPPRGRIMNIDYTVQLMGAGTAYSGVPTIVRPEADALIMACGMARTHVDTGGSETVSYAFADTGHSSCTIWAYAGGKLFKVVGCRGNWTWAPTAGGLGEIRFQLQGMLSTAPTEVAVPTITYDAVVPPAAVAIGLAIVPDSLSSWTPNTADMEITSGHEVDRFDDPNAADGIEGFFIGKTDPRFTFTPRTEDLTDYTAYAHAASQLVHTIDFTIGAVQYNQVGFNANLMYLMNDPPPDEDGNFAAWQAEYQLRDGAILFD